MLCVVVVCFFCATPHIFLSTVYPHSKFFCVWFLLQEICLVLRFVVAELNCVV